MEDLRSMLWSITQACIGEHANPITNEKTLVFHRALYWRRMVTRWSYEIQTSPWIWSCWVYSFAYCRADNTKLNCAGFMSWSPLWGDEVSHVSKNHQTKIPRSHCAWTLESRALKWHWLLGRIVLLPWYVSLHATVGWNHFPRWNFLLHGPFRNQVLRFNVCLSDVYFCAYLKFQSKK